MAAVEAPHMRIDGAMSADRLMAIAREVYGWALETNCDASEAQAWDVARMYADLRNCRAGTVAAFLLRYPEHRHAAWRAQVAARFPYAEIRDNTIGSDMLPIDLLRPLRLALKAGAGLMDNDEGATSVKFDRKPGLVRGRCRIGQTLCGYAVVNRWIG